MAPLSAFEQMRETEREIRRDHIIDSAMALFGKKPFHEIGMRDIAAEAEVSAASIYRYFPSRDDLYVEALLLNIVEVERMFKQRMAENRTSFEEIARATIDYFLENESVFHIVCHFMVNDDITPSAAKKFESAQRYFLRAFDAVISKSRSNEGVRLYSQAFFASLVGIVMTLRNYPDLNKNQITEFMHQLAEITAKTFQNGLPKN